MTEHKKRRRRKTSDQTTYGADGTKLLGAILASEKDNPPITISPPDFPDTDHPPTFFKSRRRTKLKRRSNTKYNDEYHPILAYRLCRFTGATHLQLANVFGVNRSVIEKWIQRFPKFRGALYQGKDYFDSHVAEKVLLRRALGYDIPVTDIYEKTREQCVDGDIITLHEKGTCKKVTHIAPDVKALIYFLSNRNPKRWGNNLGTVEHIHQHKVRGKVKIDFSKLSTEELRKLQSISSKAIPQEEREKQLRIEEYREKANKFVIEMKSNNDGTYTESGD